MKIIQRTPQEVYQNWITALRSGKYKQVDGQLKDTYNGKSSFCCLGVLCDLARKDGGPKWDGEEYMFEYSNLPPKIGKWMKLPKNMQMKLIKMNDDEKMTFKEIADHIEKKILPKIKD